MPSYLETNIIRFIEENNIPSLNSEKFQSENHNADNSILLHLEDIKKNSVYKDFKIIGYTKHPAFKETGFGVMFENVRDGTQFWCHAGPGVWCL